jgi:hypothetical protein
MSKEDVTTTRNSVCNFFLNQKPSQMKKMQNTIPHFFLVAPKCRIRQDMYCHFKLRNNIVLVIRALAGRYFVALEANR